MNFEPEEMKAGYSFVRIVRFLGYAALISGSAAAVVMSGMGIYGAYKLRNLGSERRAAMAEEIVKLTQEIEPAVKRAAQQEEQDVLEKSERYADSLPPYRKAFIIATSEVSKLTTVPRSLKETLEISTSIPTSLDEANSVSMKINEATRHSGDFKKLIYQEVSDGYQKMLAPLQMEYNRLSHESEQHKAKIAAAEDEIWRIKNSEKDPSIFTRTYTADGHTTPQPNVYGAESQEQAGSFSSIVTNKLPDGRNKIPVIAQAGPKAGLTTDVTDDDISTLLADADADPDPVRTKLLESINSLQEWFPHWIDGETTTVTDTFDGVKLTDAQRQRMSELTLDILDEKEALQAVNAKMAPIQANISQLEQSRQLVIDQTIETATKNWVLDSGLRQLSGAIQALVYAMEVKADHRLQKKVRQEYEDRIAGLHNSIKASAHRDAKASNLLMMVQLPIILGVLIAAWLGCFLIQVLADFMVCPLVLALRVQFDEELRRR